MLTVRIKLCPSYSQVALLNETLDEFISLVNDVLDYGIALGNIPAMTTANVKAPLPSCLVTTSACVKHGQSGERL